MLERRIHERSPVAFQVRVTSVTQPELSVIGEAVDFSKSGIGVSLPCQFLQGSLVQIEIADSSLCGFVAYSRKWPQHAEAPFARNKVWLGGPESGEEDGPSDANVYQTGIEVVEVLIGVSGLSQLLHVTLKEAMPHLELAHAQQD